MSTNVLARLRKVEKSLPAGTGYDPRVLLIRDVYSEIDPETMRLGDAWVESTQWSDERRAEFAAEVREAVFARFPPTKVERVEAEPETVVVYESVAAPTDAPVNGVWRIGADEAPEL
jgi:hypothetical protein